MLVHIIAFYANLKFCLIFIKIVAHLYNSSLVLSKECYLSYENTLVNSTLVIIPIDCKQQHFVYSEDIVMRKIICACLAAIFLLTSAVIFARGGIHSVKPYVKGNNKVVQPHLAGNPKSGIHCKHNICQ